MVAMSTYENNVERIYFTVAEAVNKINDEFGFKGKELLTEPTVRGWVTHKYISVLRRENNKIIFTKLSYERLREFVILHNIIGIKLDKVKDARENIRKYII